MRCITASDGVNALKNLKKPDLIILDIMMPAKDGYEVCKTIRIKETLFLLFFLPQWIESLTKSRA
ncbi:MAG: hypothetical protein CM15mP127_12980 [Gammaproteobacteria bacterium]|nr:MAG: hypothetical protein CM15mP127_12980 [Gammaproteobacteria bacterium]